MELERRPGNSTEGRGAGGLSRLTNDLRIAGEAVEYVPMAFSQEDSWARLSPSMQQWCEERAGAPVNDPHTGTPTVYWYCRVDPETRAGPGGGGTTATYELVLFGRRGLVVSGGSTERFVDAPGGTAWRHNRFDLPIDPSGVRSDHRCEPADAGPGAGPATAGPPSSGTQLLPDRDAPTFGNLPVATQRFLLEPFLAGPLPVTARVHCSTLTTGGEYAETYWTYLFNARWVAFAHSRRAVPYRSGLTGSALWNGSPEQAGLARAPWAVAAWVAPLQR